VHQYGVREVQKLLRLPRSTIRALIDAGFVSPARGPRKAWLFSFQDLIVLRTAQALAAAKVPRKRINKSVRQLREHLPESMPRSGLSICAVADQVVVREGVRQWQAESGQYLLAFEGDPANGTLSVFEPKRAVSGAGAHDWLERGLAIEETDVEGALTAYERAVGLDATLVDAHINRAYLLHEAGRLAQAERAYRDGIAACGDDPQLLFNFGVLLEDLGRKQEALEIYQAALRVDPRFADCHHNLALICEEVGKAQEAIRHMAEYRRLTRSKA
jgi:tetratricopeptide (TPR) repeat protein